MRTTSIAQRIRHELPDTKVPGDVDRAVREWLAADDDFNVWFLETTKGQLDDAKLLGLVEGYGGDQDEVERAWEDFRDTANESPLLACLARSLAKMEELKQK